MAARRVADENRQLRELLIKCGVTEDYIAHYLQAGTSGNSETAPTQPVRPGDHGVTVHSLQHLMVPRRAAHLDHGVHFALPSQTTREDSTASGSTAASSVWESSQSSTIGPYSHHPPPSQQLGVSPSSIGSAEHQQPHYSPSVFPAAPDTTQPTAFHGHPPGSMMNDPRQTLATTQSMPIDSRPAMYPYPVQSYNDPTPRSYGQHGGGGGSGAC